MRDSKRADAHRYQGQRDDSRLVIFSYVISICIHLVFIAALILLPDSAPRTEFLSGVVNVSLVSMPGKQPEAGTATQTVAKPKKEIKKPTKAKISSITPPPQKPVIVPPKPKKAISPAPKPNKKTPVKKKTSMKKKTLNRTKMIEGAIKNVEEKVDDSQSASVKEALNRLKKQVEQTEAARALSSQAGGSGGSAGRASGFGSGSGAGSAPRTLEVIRIYQAEIQYQIQKNWAFPPQLAGNNFELEAMLGIKILRNGEIEKVWYDKKSGNHNLDESAYKAIMKSNPLPPLPEAYSGSSYTVGLRFGPKGLK
jgi:colicin import membrane protein